MKKMKKLFVALASAAICCAGMAVSAGAATVTQDGIQVELAADKQSYSATESITATLTVKNTKEAAVEGLSLENLVPTGYQAAGANKQTAGTLEAGGQIVLKTTFTPTAKATNNNNANNNTNNGNTTPTVSSPKTGDSDAPVIGIAFAILIGACGVAVLASCMRKRGTKMLSLLFCAAIAGTMSANLCIKADADAVETATVSVYETVTVGDKELLLVGEVNLNVEPGTPSEVVERIDVTSCEDVMTEAEVVAFLSERGLNGRAITYDYTIDGQELNDEGYVDANSTAKHPKYLTMYTAKSGDKWYITVVGKCLIANPISYNLQTSDRSPLMISEDEKIYSYDDETNQYVVNHPGTSMMTLKTIEKIDAEALDALTIEEVGKL